MSQLLELIDELRTKVDQLDNQDENNQNISIYIESLLQHAINRIDFDRTLSETESREMDQRTRTINMFKQFYAYMMITDQL